MKSAAPQVAMLLMALSIAACGGTQGSASRAPARFSEVLLPPGVVKQASWVGDQVVFEMLQEDDPAWSGRLWTTDSNGGGLRRLDLATDACGETGFQAFGAPVAVRGGQFVTVERCAPPLSPLVPDLAGIQVSLAGVDVASGQILTRAPLSYFADPLAMGMGFTPDGSIALMTTGTQPAKLEGLALDGGEVQFREDLPMTQIWALASDTARQRLAFAGNRGEAGTQLVIRAELFIARSDFSELRTVVSDVEAVSGLSWSPGGDRLLFVGSHQSVQGLWVVDVGRGDVELVSEGAFRTTATAWSPDGNRVVAVQQLPRKAGERRDHRLRIFEVR